MRSLDARIEELERREPSEESVTIILVTLVAPGEVKKPITRLRDSRTSQAWERDPEESEETFVERVSAELREVNGPLVCSMLIGESD